MTQAFANENEHREDIDKHIAKYPEASDSTSLSKPKRLANLFRTKDP